jgi:ABC-type phosphate/phosphonate transport system permease subunit
MVVLTVYFWYLELRFFLDNIYYPKPRSNSIVFIADSLYAFINNLFRFFYYGRYFLIDLIATAFLVSFMGFGDAVTGAILGLTMSNALSVLILFIQRRNKRNKQLVNNA